MNYNRIPPNPHSFLSKSASAPEIHSSPTQGSTTFQQQPLFPRRSSCIVDTNMNTQPNNHTSLELPSSLSSIILLNTIQSSANLANATNTMPIGSVADFLHRLTKMLRDDNEEYIQWSDGKLNLRYF